jgi:hypothetical protein
MFKGDVVMLSRGWGKPRLVELATSLCHAASSRCRLGDNGGFAAQMEPPT